MAELEPTSSSTDKSAQADPFVTMRCVLIGLAGVILICGLAAYNDFALSNTFIIGNFLPVSLVMLVLATVLLINAPLLKWRRRSALRQGELAVILAMILAACSLPTSGLMRYLPSAIVGVYSAAVEQPEFSTSLTQNGLPNALRPTVDATQAADIGNSDVYRYFRFRSPDGVTPWAAWVKPILIWGVLVAFIWGLVLFLSLIVNTQWTENEKLAFPLATVYVSLIEEPAPGYALNSLYRSRGFWIAAGSVFAFHAFNGLHAYFPPVPEIPRGFDFTNILTEEPLIYMHDMFKSSEIFFCIIGITFFLQTRTSFSLWFLVVVLQIGLMVAGMRQVAVVDEMKQDQTFGATLMLSCVLIFTGRAHWAKVIRQMFGRYRVSDGNARFIPHPIAGWGAFICFVGVIVFLILMGASLISAVGTTLAIVSVMMVIARVVAETGIPFAQSTWASYRLWYYPLFIPSTPLRTTTQSFFVSTFVGYLFHDLRESFATFFQHGLRVTDLSTMPDRRKRYQGLYFIFAILLALFIGYFVSAAGVLWTEYNYGASLSTPAESPLNPYAVDYGIRMKVVSPLQTYAGKPFEAFSHAGHIGFGAGVVLSLSILRWTFSWWPLHPLGYVILYSWAGQKIWLSVFVGWLAKVAIVLIGGTSLWTRSKNVFIGLIIGEAAAAAFWLIFSILAHWFGFDYHRISLLPI